MLRLPEAEVGAGKTGEGTQKIKTSSYKVSPRNEMHSMAIVVNTVLRIRAAKSKP